MKKIEIYINYRKIANKNEHLTCNCCFKDVQDGLLINDHDQIIICKDCFLRKM